MSDDLKNLLSDKPDDLHLSPDDAISGQPSKSTASPTALRHDRWSRRMGRQWATSDIGKVALARAEGDDKQHLAADMFSIAWDPNPTLVTGDCDCADRRDFLAKTMESPEYKNLHRNTALDALSSEIAAGSFAKQWLDYVDYYQESPGGSPGPSGGSPSDDLDKEASMLRHARQAIARANKEVTDSKDTRMALGLEGGNGGDGNNTATKMSTDEIREHFARIRKNSQLRRIMELSGRYIRLAQTMQSSKRVHGSDDLVGLELGSDLSRVLPSELALLADEDTEVEFMRRFVEGSLICREYSETVQEARGPIVLVVDESGSMEGMNIATAKAIALAILWIARHQKRWTCLVGFSGGEGLGNYLVVPPGHNDTEDLLDWLSHFYGGGTERDVPLVELPKMWDKLGCPEGQTDIIQITDAQARVPKKMAETFNTWKESKQAKLRTIVIGCDAGELAAVSDAVWTERDLGTDSLAVRDCLSV